MLQWAVDDAREARARQRRSWPGSVVTLGHEDDAALVLGGTSADRIRALWRVTADAWASSGRPIPDYPRESIPGRIIRAGDG